MKIKTTHHLGNETILGRTTFLIPKMIGKLSVLWMTIYQNAFTRANGDSTVDYETFDKVCQRIEKRIGRQLFDV